MHDFMKTIISAVQTWTKKLIKNNTPNWDENNPEADGYVKNRPFYTTKKEQIALNESIIIPEEYLCIYNLNFQFPLKEGQTYTVVWNEESYTCLAHNDGYGGIYLGNQEYAINDGWGFPEIIISNEPFFICMYEPNNWNTVYADEGSHTLIIKTTTETIKKIDKKYLPDDIIPELAPVATSGSYYDLYDRPNVYTDVVRYNVTQSLSDTQKTTARTNIDAADAKTVDKAISDMTATLSNIAETLPNMAEIEKSLSIPKDGITLIDEVNGNTYVVSVRDGVLVPTIGIKTIEVTQMPSVTEYVHGSYLDTTDMIVTAIYCDGRTEDITNDISVNGYLVEGMTSVEIIYKKASVLYTAEVPVTVSAFDPVTILVDFDYIDNGNKTYTITGWKQTYNGVSSTEMIIPNYECIIV